MIIVLIFRALSVSFSEVWDEASDQDGVRPSDIAILLLADACIMPDAALNNNNDWKHSFSHLSQERCRDCIFP